MYSLFSHSHNPKYTILYSKNEYGNSSKDVVQNTKEYKTGTGKISDRFTKIIGGLISKKNPPTIDEWQDTVITPDSSQESNNIFREQTVVSIGDLNGNYGAFLGNLTSVGLIDKDNHWIGGDTRVVVHGDIMGDRHPHGMMITTYGKQLQNEAISNGGELIFLAGNHEDMVFAYLTGELIYANNGWQYMYIDSGREKSMPGLMELETYINPDITLEQVRSNKKINTGILLKKMRNDILGHDLLEFMCNMKLPHRIDDTLRIHVLPHPPLLQLIRERTIDEVNTLYQKGMRYYLLGIGTFSESEEKDFKNLRKEFLGTNHRKIIKGDIYHPTKNSGLNLIISGHERKYYGKKENIHGIICTAIDAGYGIKNPLEGTNAWRRQRDMRGRQSNTMVLVNKREEQHTSTLIIGTDGTMTFGNGKKYNIQKLLQANTPDGSDS